jgi:hypothetical protein
MIQLELEYVHSALAIMNRKEPRAAEQAWNGTITNQNDYNDLGVLAIAACNTPP